MMGVFKFQQGYMGLACRIVGCGMWDVEGPSRLYMLFMLFLLFILLLPPASCLPSCFLLHASASLLMPLPVSDAGDTIDSFCQCRPS